MNRGTLGFFSIDINRLRLLSDAELDRVKQFAWLVQQVAQSEQDNREKGREINDALCADARDHLRTPW
jgi:hypothetical protein